MTTTKLTVPILINWSDIQAYMEQHDIVEVVRCKYCMLFETDGDGDWGWCNNWDHKTRETGFCHDVKKKVTE